jgi:hypothetical protein
MYPNKLMLNKKKIAYYKFTLIKEPQWGGLSLHNFWYQVLIGQVMLQAKLSLFSDNWRKYLFGRK